MCASFPQTVWAGRSPGFAAEGGWKAKATRDRPTCSRRRALGRDRAVRPARVGKALGLTERYARLRGLGARHRLEVEDLRGDVLPGVHSADEGTHLAAGDLLDGLYEGALPPESATTPR